MALGSASLLDVAAAVASLVVAVSAPPSAPAQANTERGNPRALGAVGSYDNGLIAQTALRYVGQWGGQACVDANRSGLTGSTTSYPVQPGRDSSRRVTKPGDGQCRAFVNCVVWMASGHTQWLGGGYFGAFASAGARRITDLGELTTGDVVQVGSSDSDSSLHTYIVVEHVKGDTFLVVDSNHDLKETVAEYQRKLVLGENARAFRLGTVPAAEKRIEEVASYAGWRAMLSYVSVPSPGYPPQFADFRLRVTRATKTVLDVPVASTFWPAGWLTRSKTPSLSFRELDGVRTSPELVLEWYSGGAHCCFTLSVYSFRDRVRTVRLDLGETFGRFVPGRISTLVVGIDNRFDYLFAAHGDAGVPVWIWQMRPRGSFATVTSSYPTLVKADAAAWSKAIRSRLRSSSDLRGLASAWAADEAMLGRANEAKQILLAEADRGFFSKERSGGGLYGRAFVGELWKALKRFGYLG